MGLTKMPYLPETDELLFDDEERHWVSTHSEDWEMMMKSSTLPHALALSLRSRLTKYRSRQYIPAAAKHISLLSLNGVFYRKLLVDFKWDTDAKDYAPGTVCGLTKGARHYKPVGQADALSLKFADALGTTHESARRLVSKGNTWRLAWDPSV